MEMIFNIDHTNLNVLNLEKSLSFYQKALGLKEQRRKAAGDGSFTLVFLSDDKGTHCIELTCLHNRKEPYALGDNETHIAFSTPDINAARKLHQEMDCICFENPEMGIYFIEDPDGYWLEIIQFTKSIK
jgi:lactoylglutathione lyase